MSCIYISMKVGLKSLAKQSLFLSGMTGKFAIIDNDTSNTLKKSKVMCHFKEYMHSEEPRTEIHYSNPLSSTIRDLLKLHKPHNPDKLIISCHNLQSIYFQMSCLFHTLLNFKICLSRV